MAKRKTKKVDRIKISACYIVKDAEKDLARSLASLSRHVDEIIVVDTGSSDGTIDVAKKFGAKIFNSPWQNDFATPRNVALEAATGDWIVFLDADEFFIDDTAKNLRAAVKLAQAEKVRGVFVKIVNVDADNGNKIQNTSTVMRLFANSPGVHYVGKIHEQVFVGDELLTDFIIVPAEMLTIWHTGYSEKKFRSKMERNLAALLDEFAVTDKPERIYGYLAETYNALGDATNAEKFARADVEAGTNFFSNSIRILIEILSRDNSRADEFFKYLRVAVERYPKTPEFSAKLAEELARRGDYRAAADEMKRALTKADNYGDEIESSTFSAATRDYCNELLTQWSEKIQLTPEERRKKISVLTDELIQCRELFHDKEKILRTAEKIFALKPDEPAPVEKVASLYLDYEMADEANLAVDYLEKNFPPSPYRLYLRACACRLAKNLRDCIEFAERALTLGGADFITQMLIHNILGQAYRFVGESQKAIDHYEINAKLDLSPLANSPQLEQAKQIQLDEYDNFLFNLHNINVTREKLFAETCGFNKFFAQIPRYKHDIKRHARHKKIRIGYISPDVRFHVVAFFSAHFFKSYDRTRFEVFVYANNRADKITEQFKANVDGFRDILDKPSREVAEKIFRDEIDILVDLAGHTANNSLTVLAYKPAPVQISGIGWFDSTGLDAVDYFIADKFTDPEGLNEKFFTEKILRLQHSHFCYTWHDFPFMTTPAPAAKKGYVTFGSFNGFAKVTDDMLKLWAKILDAVPNSRLFLKSRTFRPNCGLELVRKRMIDAGLDVERVDFEPDETDYVRKYEQVDIALDTFPYPGGGTTCDALYMGVPVITLVGERHGSRFGYSLLVNAGLAELCAFTPEEYVQKAVELARDLPRLREYHLTIRRKLEVSPVMNDAIYMGEIELAYEKIFAAWTNNQPLPDFPQNPAPITEKLAREYYQRATSYVKLETSEGSKFPSRFDFKRTLYFAELAETCDAVRDAQLYLTIADRRFMTDDGKGAYDIMHTAVEYCYPPKNRGKNLEPSLVAEYHAKLAKFANRNGHYVEGVENLQRAFELADSLEKQLEFYDAILLNLHFTDISAEEMAAFHFDYQNLLDGIKPFTTYRKRGGRIKVGYISGDFRRHAMFAVTFGFVSCHDRSKFEIFCYSRSKIVDQYTELYRRGVEHFVDVSDLDAEKLAKKIHDDGIDIAFDLSGHSSGNALQTLAYRPAPVQISGLGYMSTTGSKTIDYFVTDEIVDPPGNEKFFSEKLLYMPAQYSCARREDLPVPDGAPCVKNGYVTFGTICRYSKINDDILTVWREILARVPDAKLLMRAQEYISNRTVDELYRRMKAIGFDMDKIIFRPAVPDYFRAISKLDIILDSYPYVGGATTLDALYMGVPVINFHGERRSTRFGLSILTSIGLGDLSVDSADEYINRAVGLARDTETLDLLHKNLRSMFVNSPALDPMKYARLLEQKFAKLLPAT